MKKVYWKVIKTFLEPKKKKYTSPSERKKCLALCTKCNKTKKVISHRALKRKKTLMCRPCSAKIYASNRTPWSAFAPLSKTSYGRRLWKSRYHSMMSRCYNKSNKDYKNYGGRGIKVRAPLNTPQGFVKTILTLKNWNKAGYSIDRINNDKDYSKSNIRMSIPSQQSLNRRPTHETKDSFKNILSNKKNTSHFWHFIEKDFSKSFKTKKTYWKCKCKLCNNTRSVMLTSIIQNNSKSCRDCSYKIRTSNILKGELNR